MKTFTLTAEHIALLRHLAVYSDHGAPQIDAKRPYGNGDYLPDICRIVGWTKAGDDGHAPCWSTQQRSAARRLHEQMAIALECVLRSGSFEPGEFRRDDRYRWERA